MTSQTVGMRRWAKPLRFGILGALGCLGAALLGEGWLWMTSPAPLPPPPPPPPQAVALVLDMSGSMAFDRDAVVEAAKGFVNTQDAAHDRAAVVHFDTTAGVDAPLSGDRNALDTALDGLQVAGTTNMDAGLQEGAGALQGASEARSILLFTDGAPTSRLAALQAAQAARNSGIRIVAVATPGADRLFLEQATGDPKLVFVVGDGQFGQAFQNAQAAIYGSSLTGSAPVQDNRSGATWIFIVAVWTGLLGLGLSLALLWGQANYFRRALFEPGFARRDVLGMAGGVGAGLVSGAVAQWFFASTGGASEIGRVVAWGVLGALLGRGMTLFVPNLDARRAWQFGALGGGVGALGFLMFAGVGSDVAARLSGAALLGFAIGLLVALAEATARRAWLQVEGVGGSEVRFDVNLGETPVAVGADRARCVIFAPGAAPLEGRFGLEGGRPFFQPGESARQWLSPGETRDFGAVRVTLQQPTPEVAAPVTATPFGVAPLPLQPNSAPLPPAFGTRPGAPQMSFAPPIAAQSAPVQAAVEAQPTNWVLESAAGVLRIGAGQTLGIGRAPHNDCAVADSTVSSQHARLSCDAGGLHLTDLDSTNGSFVNGAALVSGAPQLLHPGDRVRLGAVEWLVRALD